MLSSTIDALLVLTNGLPTTNSRVRERGSETTLEAASAYIERSIRSNGGYAAIPEGEHSGYEWRAFRRWADERSLILSTSPQRFGGREHDISFDQDTGRWIKYTKPWSAGYNLSLLDEKLLMLPATPLQYLRRWRIANRLFGHDTELLGLYCGSEGERIVVSQADAQGRAATWTEIDNTFRRKLGMRQILSQDPLGAYSARAYKRSRFAVFDVRPVNCVVLDVGTLVPIDVIPQALTRSDAETLDRMYFF